MPRIPQYQAPIDKITPSDRGTEAQTMAGRRIGHFYSQAAGEISSAARAGATAAADVAHAVDDIGAGVRFAANAVEDYQAHKEVSAGAAASAKLFSQLSDEWDARVKNAAVNDPNDPTVAAKFREDVLEPALQKFTEGFSNTTKGRNWSETHAISMRNHFFQKSAGDMGGLAAKAAESNVQQVGSQASNAAFKSPDFHTVDYLLGKIDGDIGAVIDSAPNLKGGESAKLRMALAEQYKDNIVKSAAAGAIAQSSDPEKTAQRFADRYPEYLSGAEVKAFAKAAKTQAKVNQNADNQIEIYKRQQQDRAVHAASAKLMTDHVTFDDNGRPTIKPQYFKEALDIARRYPDAPSASATVHSAITWGEHQQNQKAQVTVSDPQVKSKLYEGLFDPTNPTTEVDLMRANVENKLSTHDFAAMHGLQKTLEETPLKGEVMKDTLAAVKASLTYSMPGLPGRDPKGLQNYSAFIQTFVPKYLAMHRAGTLPPNALDTRDPNSMISQAMAPFKRTQKQLIQDRVQELSSLGDITSPNVTVTGVSTEDRPLKPVPPVGTVVGDYKFLGGDPSRRESWGKK